MLDRFFGLSKGLASRLLRHVCKGARSNAVLGGLQVGGSPEQVDSIPDQPRGHCVLAMTELGLAPHHIDDTLAATGNTMLKLGLIPDVSYVSKM